MSLVSTTWVRVAQIVLDTGDMALQKCGIILRHE